MHVAWAAGLQCHRQAGSCRGAGTSDKPPLMYADSSAATENVLLSSSTSTGMVPHRCTPLTRQTPWLTPPLPWSTQTRQPSGTRACQLEKPRGSGIEKKTSNKARTRTQEQRPPPRAPRSSPRRAPATGRSGAGPAGPGCRPACPRQLPEQLPLKPRPAGPPPLQLAPALQLALPSLRTPRCLAHGQACCKGHWADSMQTHQLCAANSACLVFCPLHLQRAWTKRIAVVY